MNVIKGKVGKSISRMRFGITAATSIGWGRRNAWTKTRQCGRKVCVWDHLWKPRKAKKILFEKLFSRNKKINALTEVTENQYLTASGIKSFHKQTAGNNRPVYMTDPRDVSLRAAEISVKRGKTSDVVYWKLTQRSRFTLSRAYGSRLACQHFISQFSQTIVYVAVTRSAVN